MTQDGRKPLSPLWSLVYSATIIHISGFILFMILIRLLWVELNDYFRFATGVSAHYILGILLVTAVILLLIAYKTAGVLSSGRDAGGLFKTAVVISFLLFNGLALALATSMAKYSIPSFAPFTRICIAFALMGTAFLLLIMLFQFLATRKKQGDAHSIKNALKPGGIYTIIFIIAFLYLGTWSLITDMNKWAHRKVAAQRQEWRASWISVQDSSILQKMAPSVFKYRENMWICFRKGFDLERVPQRLIARIGADSKYWLYINGRLAVFEGGLKRGPNPCDTYYDRVDIAPFLKKGKNTIAVLLWHFGRDGFGHKSSGVAGLIFECTDKGIVIKSDDAWKAIIHPAYYNTGAPHPNFRLQESNIGFDARRDMPGWADPHYDDSKWEKALVIARPPAEPFNNLVERPIPQWRTGTLRAYTSTTIRRSAGKKIIECELPYNAQITPYLKIKSPAGLKLDMRTDNYFGGGAYNVRAEYVTRDGTQEHESMGWMNGHRMIYTIPDGVEILELKYRETGYDAEFAGAFHCNDEFFNSLWNKSRRTLYVGMRDYLMDCPDRERAQWWCESYMLMAFYSLDDKGRLLIKKSIDEIFNWRKRDGALYAPAPSGNWFIELPIQMVAVIGRYGLWTYYMYTGDLDTIRRVYPYAKKYLALWDNRNDGLVVPREGQWNQADWGENIDLFLFSNEWYYIALLGMKNIAEELGHPKDAEFFEKRMKEFKAGFDRTFWTTEGYRSPGFGGLTDDRSNAMAVVADLASPDKYEILKKVLVKNRFGSPYMEKYAVEALIKMGYINEGMARLKERFGDMVKSRLTTLWEGWEVGSFDYGGGTINHPWAGSGMIILSQLVGGIEPVKPGFREFRIMPREGNLESIDERVRTRHGDILLRIRNDKSVYRLTAAVPPGTRAHVHLHKRNSAKRYAKRISVNDTPMLQAAGKTPRTVMDTSHPDYYRISVSPGKYRFVVEY